MRADRRTGGLAVGVGRARLVLAVAAAFLTAGPSDRLSAQVDRTRPPALPPPPALKLPAVQTYLTGAHRAVLSVVPRGKPELAVSP